MLNSTMNRELYDNENLFQFLLLLKKYDDIYIIEYNPITIEE